jgi:hypothetical protein
MDVQQTSDKVLRYRIEAMALAAAEVVAGLGGVLFDRRCLGWDTVVLLEDRTDIRPLQIIGADCADLRSTLDIPHQPESAALATSIQLYRSDPRVCARVDAAIDSGSTEVLLWGDTGSTGPKPQMIAVAHHVSQAAVTFKTHALIAASGARASTDLVVEQFLATRATWQPPHTHQRSTVIGTGHARPRGSRIRHEDANALEEASYQHR